MDRQANRGEPESAGSDGTADDRALDARDAEAYDRHWGPAIAPASRAVLDLPAVETVTASGDRLDVLDLGAGTGALTVAALDRWPRARVTAVDASAAMLDRLGDRLAGRPADLDRTTLVTALADGLPLADGSIDLVVSSFMLQLVPSRRAALAEVRRVLRPAGVVAHVTWLRGGPPFRPDDVFFDLARDHGALDDEDGAEPPGGDFASVRAAADGLRRAGFREVRAHGTTHEHAFTPASYVDFLQRYAEVEIFESLPERGQGDLRAATLAAVAALPAADLVLRLPIVYASGRRR